MPVGRTPLPGGLVAAESLGACLYVRQFLCRHPQLASGTVLGTVTKM